MELKWAEDFVELASCGSFSRAAERRHVTQSAFSRRIRALEHWVGAPLIDRSRHPTRLTNAGEHFLTYASPMVLEAYRVRDELRGTTRTGNAPIHFAALHTIALTVFPSWIGSVVEEGRQLRTRVTADNLHDCVELLEAGSCDFLLSYSHPSIAMDIDASKFMSLPISHDRIVPVVGPDVDFDWKLPSTEKAIPYLRYSDETLLGRIVRLIHSDKDTVEAFDPIYENSMAEALKAMALKGVGLAWLPLSSVADDIARGLLERCYDACWETDVDVRLYRTREPQRRAVEAVWASVKAQSDAR